MPKLISIVIPAYNEADTIENIFLKTQKVMATMPYAWEIIFIDDGSNDNSIAILKKLSQQNDNVFFLEFSRNFGHQLALKAGLDHAYGDCVISLDCDAQHPPEIIPSMVKKWEEGYEIVYTIRAEDKKLSRTKRSTSKMFYKLINSLSEIELEAGTADFRLLDAKVVAVFRNFNETEPFLRGLIKWLGFKQYGITYQPEQRFAGTSKYSVKKMFRLALQGVTSFSIKPLYTAVYIGVCMSLLSLLYIPYVLHALYNNVEVSGWASTIMTIVFFGGVQLIMLGIIGIYVGKMFMQSKNRPNYIISTSNLKNK